MNFKKIAFLTGLAISGISFSSVFAPANAANFTVLTDTPTNLDIEWIINPIDTGGNPIPTFDIPTIADLTNWKIISATYTYNGGGTPSDVAVQAQHIVAPHVGDAAIGNIANIGFSFPYTSTPGIGGFTPVVSVAHPAIGHTDNYQIFWGYANANIGAGGTLVTELKGVHTTPEPTSTLSILALGILGTSSTLKRKLQPSKSTEKETTKVG